MPFLEKMPQILCEDKDGKSDYCTQKDYCKDGQIDPEVKWYVDYDDDQSIQNWVTQMDLY